MPGETLCNYPSLLGTGRGTTFHNLSWYGFHDLLAHALVVDSKGKLFDRTLEF